MNKFLILNRENIRQKMVKNYFDKNKEYMIE